MGGPGPSRCWVGVWACVACVALLCPSLSAEPHLTQPAEAAHVPLPLLLESLRQDVLLERGAPGRAPRTARDAAGDDGVPWYSPSTRAGDDTLAQEELNVTSVYKRDPFKFGAGVGKWHSISAGSTTYLVGLGSKHFTLLTANFVAPDVGTGQTFSLSEEIYRLPSTPLAATIFKHWNAATKTMDVILVLSTENEGSLIWYRINSRVEQIRSWPVQKRVSHLRVFQIKEQMKLLMLTSCESTLELVQCEASADVFDFNLGNSLEARLSWSISLEAPAVSGDLGVVGDEVYLVLALPDAGVAKLYRYHSPLPQDAAGPGNHTAYGSFELWKDLPSPQISHAIFFHISYKMYLAVGGVNPALFRFVSPTRIEGCPKALKNLGFVSAWLVLPIQTYRDEVILLAEVVQGSGTHYSKKVVTLTWSSAGVFNWQDYPCFVSGHLSTFRGASCIIAESSELGLAEAVALQLGDASVVSVLVPQGSLHSTLFDFQTQLQPNANPLLSEILILKEAQAKLTEELTRQRQEWEATERLLSDTLNPSGHNVIKADWVIQEIQPEEFVNVETSRTETLQPTEDLSKLKSLMTELEALTKSLSLSLSDAAVPENGEVHLSGHHQLLGGLEVQGPASFDSLTVSWLNEESVPTLLKDTVRIDQLEKGTISGTKTLSALEVSDVMFDIVNDVQRDDLIFNVPGKTVRVNGVLEVTEILQVQNDIDLPPQGTVGGVDLSEEVLIAGRQFPGIVQFDEVTVEGDLTVNVINTVDMNPHNLKSIVNGSQILKTFDMLDVGGQLSVERINGFLWSNIVERIVWRDQPAVITGLTEIDGVLTADSMKIEQLNGLNFPDDFVLKNANKSQLITASKKFNDKLMVGTVDFAKTIDGVPVNALVTKTTDQYLNGELKLAEADIIGDIKVDGAVNGIRLNRQKSPPLGPNVVVSSNVQFTNLTVDGTIQIINTLNEQIFKDVVQDILVVPPTSHGQVFLDGKKTLLGSLKVDNVMVSSGLVNGRKIADIARIDSPQTFHGGKTIQKAVFNNLQVTGLVDGVDVVELNAEAVRLTGVQDTLSHLTFTESSKIFAAELIISEQLGNTPVSDTILPTSEDMCGPRSTNLTCYIKGPVITDVMRVAGNVIGDKICGWNLIDFENRRMSQSRPQTILGGYTFGDVTVTKHIDVSYINGVPVHTLARETAPPPPPVYEDLAKLLIDGGFTIDELVIEGHIETLAGVNTFNLTRIAEKAIKLNGSNTISGSLSFEDIVTVSSLDVTGPVDGHNLAFEIEDAVIKNLGPVSFSGRKTFAEGFIVDENIKTGTLNGLTPSSILTKTTPAIIHGTLKVNGNVYAGNINLTGLLNNIPVTNFQNRYKLVAENRHLLIGNAHFEKGVSVDDLSVMQSVKNINLEDFFKSVVYKAEPTRITGFKVFVNQVVFENVNVRGRVNNLTLGEMAKDIVLHNDDNPVTINGRIRFEDSLTVTNGVSISKNLQAMELDSCLVKEWLDNAIYLSQSTQIFGLKQFKSVGSNSDLKISVLNAVDLSKVITLNTPQDIPADLNIIAAAVERDLNVARTVNGKILQTEYDNTLMIGGNQRVTGSKSFLKGFTVQNNVLTGSLISERNISNSVTLNDDETVNGPLQFSNMVIDQDLRVTGLVSNLDVQKWHERALLKKSPLPQIVTAFYDVQGKIKCMEAVGGNGLLGGESVSELVDSAYRRRELTRKTQNDIKVEWSQLCHDTDALLDKARAQPFLFRQLEVVQSIVSSQSIASMHAFEALDQQFLAVSYSNNCSGAMYRWNRGNTAWDLVDGAVENIGSVEKWATLRNAGSTYLVTSGGNQGCPYQGGNIWQIESSFRPRNVQSMDAWQDAEIDESVGHIHLLRQSGVDQWRLADGVASKVKSWPLPETGAPSHFVPRSSGLGLSISVGENVTVLEELGENITTRMVSRASNSYLPFGNSVTMKIADGRKLVVVTAEGSDLLVVYEDLVTANPLARVKVHGAHSLSVLELTAPGRNGQTLLAFIENEKFLRVVEYKGVEGFVDVTGAKLPFAVKEMIPVRLNARAFVNQRHFLLLRTDHQVLLLEVEMSGDPLDEPALNCSLP